ncbi:hypothetical protein Tsubulata_031295 [Turnera subulata]|uniref:Uncharacterized protein n=1 Tax=Turnera subulata TaxID=218843 RepID=A0A9Q0J1I1_9ROSI|nr:hypothetical protein Tsubulata_031295 [Turnera subulata]
MKPPPDARTSIQSATVHLVVAAPTCSATQDAFFPRLTPPPQLPPFRYCGSTQEQRRLIRAKNIAHPERIVVEEEDQGAEEEEEEEEEEMVMLCFVLDLCGLSPPLLGNLKQCLLQLANLYAISSSSSSRNQSESLRDKIGVCYLSRNRISSSPELKIAYSPSGTFSLRDFHHAVNNLPADAFLPEINGSGALGRHDVKLSSILSDQVLYSWGGKDIMRKVIVLSSNFPENIDSAMKKILTDAADKCVSLEFIMFEQSSSHLENMQENVNCFVRSLSDLDNCSFQTCLPGLNAKLHVLLCLISLFSVVYGWNLISGSNNQIAEIGVFHGLLKRWIQELKEDMEEPLQARFIFKTDLMGSLNHISCSLSTSVNQIIDGFTTFETCKCHGALLDITVQDKKRLCCPITGHDLGISDVNNNSVKVGDRTVLFMPSIQRTFNLQQVSSPVIFNVIERTNMRTLSEGIIFGSSYFVTPSAGQDELETSSDQMDLSELNAQRYPEYCFHVSGLGCDLAVFQGICSSLHSMDQGLICSSYCNTETMREAAFYCYYVLQPSDNGPMLLRRVAGSEEVLPIPDVNQLVDATLTKEIQNSIQASLLKVELRDYNPLLHERGFHQKLTLLIKESLQFGSIPPKLEETTIELNSNQPDSSEVIVIDAVAVEEETPILDLTTTEDNTTASIAEEWEQLVVNEAPTIYSPTCISKPKVDQLLLSSPDSTRQLDAKTSRILERLEVPRQLKTKSISPIVTSSRLSETCAPPKKPLIPFQPTHRTDQTVTSSQLMKPNFQRLKRKHK